MNFTIAGIALAVSVALGGWVGQHFTAIHYEHVIDGMKAQAETARETERIRSAAAATKYEEWKAAQRPKSTTATRKVEHEIQADPVWATSAVPSRVRDAIAAAVAATGAGVPDDPVPALPAASDRDQWGLGARLRLGLGLGSGLPGPAQGAR